MDEFCLVLEGAWGRFVTNKATPSSFFFDYLFVVKYISAVLNGRIAWDATLQLGK